MSNSLGEVFRITIFGESHGNAIGVVIDGCPAGLKLSREDVQKEVDRRKPQSSGGQTARREADKVEILSGIFEGRTTGAAITLLVKNQDVDSGAYKAMRFTPRPAHADYTAGLKYGGFNDYRGGGIFSGRVTVALVMAGAVAKKLLEIVGIEILAHTRQIGSLVTQSSDLQKIRQNVNNNSFRCGDPETANKMQALVDEVVASGDSLGGVVECLALNVPVGLGEPYFDTLEGQLAKAFFAIPAVKGVEFGAGFSVATKKGSENNDPFKLVNNRIETESNNAGGILGGISNGMPVVARVAIKPTPSISLPQATVNLREMSQSEIKITGRHDSCIVPRAAVVIEAMMAVTLCDLALRVGILKRIIK